MPARRYSKEPANPTKTCKARGSDLRVHFKNTRETAAAIKKMSLKKAKRFLEDVIQKKQAVPFRRYSGGVGRHAQVKAWKGATQARWPRKSAEVLLGLLINAESNAELKGLNTEGLHVSHIRVSEAPKQRRRTYRAHGRIGPYMSCPCHVELHLTEREVKAKKVKKTPKAKKAGDASADAAKKKKKVSQKKLAKERAKGGN